MRSTNLEIAFVKREERGSLRPYKWIRGGFARIIKTARTCGIYLLVFCHSDTNIPVVRIDLEIPGGWLGGL